VSSSARNTQTLLGGNDGPSTGSLARRDCAVAVVPRWRNKTLPQSRHQNTERMECRAPRASGTTAEFWAGYRAMATMSPTRSPKAAHREPDVGKLARPVRRAGWRNRPQQWDTARPSRPYVGIEVRERRHPPKDNRLRVRWQGVDAGGHHDPTAGHLGPERVVALPDLLGAHGALASFAGRLPALALSCRAYRSAISGRSSRAIIMVTLGSEHRDPSSRPCIVGRASD
jgi:hypothetical protein